VGIGGIAYASERPILDLVGLADKHIARSKRAAGAAIGHDHQDNDYVLGRAPELVLPLDWLTDEVLTPAGERAKLDMDPTMWAAAIALLNDARFQAAYEAHDYPVGDKHLRIWVRNDLVHPMAFPEAARADRP